MCVQILRSRKLEIAIAIMGVRMREFSWPSVCTTFWVRKDFCWIVFCSTFWVSFFICQALLQSGFDWFQRDLSHLIFNSHIYKIYVLKWLFAFCCFIPVKIFLSGLKNLNAPTKMGYRKLDEKPRLEIGGG